MKFYFFYICNSVLGLIFYSSVREGIYYLLKYRKRSDTFIKKHKKGIKNFLLFEEINEVSPLGFWYTFNKLYIICAIANFLIAIILGNVSILRIPALVVSCGMCIIMSIAIIFEAVYLGLALYGCFPVSSQKIHPKHHIRGIWYSSIKDLAIVIFIWLFWILMLINI